MNPSARCRRGFTLIEFLVAAFLSFFVIVAVGELIMVSQDAWDRGFVKLNVQQDGSYLVEEVTRALRSRSSYVIGNHGSGTQNRVDFDTDAGIPTDDIDFWGDGTNVYVQRGTAAAARVIPSGVSQIRFTANPVTAGALDMDITLTDRAGNTVRYLGTVSPRN